MNYGIISEWDDVRVTKTIFKSKRIPEQNIVSREQIGMLVKHLRPRDVVYVLDVSTFYSVSQLVNFGRYCMTNGIVLHVINQPYLDVGNGKNWKTSVVKQMMKMCESEKRATGRMVENLRLTRQQWEVIFRSVELMNLEIMAEVFSSDGILKRGN